MTQSTTTLPNRDAILALLSQHPSVAVSVLAPLDRSRPQNLEDPRRLTALLGRALDAIAARDGIVDRADLVERLHRSVGEIDAQLAHPGDGVALFVTPTAVMWWSLPFSPSERVVVADTFAVRDLLWGVQDQPTLLALVLAKDEARLFRLDRGDLEAVVEGEFPMRLSAPHELDAPHRDLPIHETAHDEARFVFRAVARALDEVDDHTPMIVVAAERDLSLFREVARQPGRVVATVHGNHLHTPTEQLAQLVIPARADYVRDRRARAVAALIDAIDAQQVATDPLEVLRAAREGRGRTLLVDRTFELHGHADADHFEFVEGDANREPDVVESVVAAVLGHGGDVVFTEPGELPDGLHLALTLRW